MTMNKNNFLFYKMISGSINHDQLPNEDVLHSFFAFMKQ